MPRTLIFWLAFSWLLAACAWGHHSFAAEYDGNKAVTVKGVVAKVAWVNPHAYIYVKTNDESGKPVTYAFETSSPKALLRRGWKRTLLKEGEQVTVEGWVLAVAALGTEGDGGAQEHSREGRSRG
jgi:Family of unknown function (DUF6152)